MQVPERKKQIFYFLNTKKRTAATGVCGSSVISE
jgi:hypothetical protein